MEGKTETKNCGETYLLTDYACNEAIQRELVLRLLLRIIYWTPHVSVLQVSNTVKIWTNSQVKKSVFAATIVEPQTMTVKFLRFV